jgi:hypothetical protein
MISGFKQKILEINKNLVKIKEENKQIRKLILPGHLQDSIAQLNAYISKCRRLKNVMESVQGNPEILDGEMGPSYQSLSMVKLILENQALQAELQDNAEKIRQLKEGKSAKKHTVKEEEQVQEPEPEPQPEPDNPKEGENEEDQQQIQDDIKQLRDSMSQSTFIMISLMQK